MFSETAIPRQMHQNRQAESLINIEDSGNLEDLSTRSTERRDKEVLIKQSILQREVVSKSRNLRTSWKKGNLKQPES